MADSPLSGLSSPETYWGLVAPTFTPREEARVLRDAEIARQRLDAAPSTHNVNRSPESPRSIRSLDTLDSEARIIFSWKCPLSSRYTMTKFSLRDTQQPIGIHHRQLFPHVFVTWCTECQ